MTIIAITYINTQEVANISKDIISLTDDLNREFTNLFTRFSGVPTITKEWVGNQASIYFDKVASDKQQYINFCNQIRNIGYKLTNNLYEVQNCINKNNTEEWKKES